MTLNRPTMLITCDAEGCARRETITLQNGVTTTAWIHHWGIEDLKQLGWTFDSFVHPEQCKCPEHSSK